MAGCTSTTARFLPVPIPLGLDGNALTSTATVNDFGPFPVVIDTGSPITAWDDGQNHTVLQNGKFVLLDAQTRPRLELDDLRFYATPLHAVGPSGFAIGAVLGGDNLQRW